MVSGYRCICYTRERWYLGSGQHYVCLHHHSGPRAGQGYEHPAVKQVPVSASGLGVGV